MKFKGQGWTILDIFGVLWLVGIVLVIAGYAMGKRIS